MGNDKARLVRIAKLLRVREVEKRAARQALRDAQSLAQRQAFIRAKTADLAAAYTLQPKTLDAATLQAQASFAAQLHHIVLQSCAEHDAAEGHATKARTNLAIAERRSDLLVDRIKTLSAELEAREQHLSNAPRPNLARSVKGTQQ